VLYCHGYMGTDPEYFKTHDFYFRGLAVGTSAGGGFDQNFKIEDLIGDAKLQQY